jgi:hypothetical protein
MKTTLIAAVLITLSPVMATAGSVNGWSQKPSVSSPTSIKKSHLGSWHEGMTRVPRGWLMVPNTFGWDHFINFARHHPQSNIRVSCGGGPGCVDRWPGHP